MRIEAALRTGMVTCLALAALWAISGMRASQPQTFPFQSYAQSNRQAIPPLNFERSVLQTQPPPAPTGERSAGAVPPAPPADADLQAVFSAGDGREHMMQVSSPAVLDSRTLAIGALRLQLEGVELEDPSEICKLPSGQLATCADRARTQLELQVRWRSLQCRYRLNTLTFAIGSCRAGDVDLAERLRAARPTWRNSADPAAVIAAARKNGSSSSDGLLETMQPATMLLQSIAAPVPAEAFAR